MAPDAGGVPVAVFHSRDAAACREHALVLTALGIEHAVTAEAGWHVIVVAPDQAARARDELLRFDAENAARSPADEPARTLASGADGAVAYALVLVVVWICSRGRALGLDWEQAGESVAGRFREGEWWRAVTALTLHADAAHLAGNLLFGAAFVWFAGQLAGSGLAAGAVLLCGALGNALNACVQPAGHHSLGASTAVFGALGLLAALHAGQRARRQLSRLRRWAPVVAGVLLVGYLGTEGPRTDVAAHVAGFLSGLLLGVLLGRPLQQGALDRRWQWGAGLGALVLLAIAWAAAFGAI